MNIELLGKRLKDLRISNDKLQKDVANFLGITDVAYGHYEKGTRVPPADMLLKLSKYFNVSIDYLLKGVSSKIKMESNRIPVLGVIPAGIPIEMIEDIIDYEELSENMLIGEKEYFALRIQGNSMNPKYLTGDNVIVLKQNDCESGQDCVVSVNGDVATLKRVIKNTSGIVLQPLNPDYEMKFYNNEEIEKLPIRILGVVVEIRRKV